MSSGVIEANHPAADLRATRWAVCALFLLNGVGIASWAAHIPYVKEKFALTFPLLADEDHAVSQAYGTWVEKMQHGRASMGVKRSTFLIDPVGRIAHVWPTVVPEGHAAQVHAELERAQAAAGS